MTSLPSDYKLKHLLIVFRHGDRTPIMQTLGPNVVLDENEKNFWISKLANEEQVKEIEKIATTVGDISSTPWIGGTWPNGQLTQRGIDMMVEKGKELHDQYKSIFTTPFPHDEVYVRSTNVVRTIQSAKCILSGMFPEHFSDNNIPKFQIHIKNPCSLLVKRSGVDYMTLSSTLKEARHASPVNIEELEKQVHSALGLAPEEDVQWTLVREVMVCRRAHSFPYPEGIDEKHIDDILLHNAWEWFEVYSNKQRNYQAFSEGAKEVFGYLKDAAEDHLPHKVTLLSAHDDSIVALMNSFDLKYNLRFPEYGTILAFEVLEHVETKGTFIQAVFNGEKLHFGGHTHSSLCPYSDVEKTIDVFCSHASP